MKIGDAVTWADVPSGALVLHGQVLYMRIAGEGWCVGDTLRQAYCMFGCYFDGEPSSCPLWQWETSSKVVTILALGLTGSETKETLSMLVRHFEESKS